MKALFAVALLSLAVAGCNSGEALSPVPQAIVDAGADAAADAGVDASPPDAGTVKRTVMTRSPFGGPAGNLLVDGDFEMSTVPQAGAQLGWRAFALDGKTPVNINTETGGLCRSGLRCAVVDPTMQILIRGASAAQGKGNMASGWAKVPSGAYCKVIRPLTVDCGTDDREQGYARGNAAGRRRVLSLYGVARRAGRRDLYLCVEHALHRG